MGIALRWGIARRAGLPKAGMMPTKPPASGMVAVATETVCSTTFSSGPNDVSRYGRSSLKTPKPRMVDCSEPIVTQPVCRPKYTAVAAAQGLSA